MTDPLFRMLARLPQAEPRRDRAARARSACHAALARQRQRRSPGPERTSLWEPLVAGLGGLYLTEVIRQTLHLYGVL